MTNYDKIQAFVYQEARHLDDKQWDEWLQLYDEKVTFWMPSWDDEDKLTTNHETEISLIYYPNRNGLEDRVFRIRTERSSATLPDTRTSHNCTNLEILEENNDEVKIRFNWNTLSFRYNKLDQFFGVSFYTLKKVEDSFLITNKKVILKNDYIRQVLDIYHI
ncbi:benzoate 1,2-dioxygenase small subunit [Flavobacterium gawalongense]|uniref:Benzoate 1,2-dioxygenase small subunit n=1 Tax=Flavobacterium gawalongense TaxID=2594432 RepID=A0A553BSN3_9FLAO|nr:benzoate 1,2-dioxygenase small subunit [Flavobacterium gawalongense]TRX03743.1 benzoate 1,2-dioxygenase small subunit [Flavobacterium gawalongense]TRX08890.1 benzoate 1,2-dioxygenase small subunit [Flavobacterium gawalongense]TRX11245.1 benzoate 1,2-dioxygenase small subunit [Flavobacterium gawalongense]TRX12294.1 benzoate 1,2-dioxygenase small subunit [Flavobacterium gawalongense]TRX30167.1 benzoate 1,2-dioxygenase small subunit [Flavobacterium gawalongense]